MVCRLCDRVGTSPDTLHDINHDVILQLLFQINKVSITFILPVNMKKWSLSPLVLDHLLPVKKELGVVG